MSDLDLLTARLRADADTWVPRTLAGLHIGPELTADLLSTTRRAWAVASGRPALVRFLRPQWREDAELVRRFGRVTDAPAHPRVVPPTVDLEGPTPHIRWALPGPLARDLWWGDDAPGPPDPVEVAGLAAERVRIAEALASIDAPLRDGLELIVVQAPDGARVVWLDRFGAPGTPGARLARLTADVRALDPHGDTPAGALVAGWHGAPAPLTPGEAAASLVAILKDALLESRHLLVRQHRLSTAGSRAARLRRQVRRLAAAVPPPPAHACLSDEAEAGPLWIWSDGSAVRGGHSPTGIPATLPVVWTRADGLDARAARTLLRAIPAKDRPPLLRWLAGQARLRRAERLLRAWSVGSLSR